MCLYLLSLSLLEANLFLHIIIQKPSKSTIKHTLSLWNVHIHRGILCLYYPTHCEITFVSLGCFKANVLKSCAVLWRENCDFQRNRTAFCLFVIIVKKKKKTWKRFFSKERGKLLERGVYDSNYSLTKWKSWLQSNKVRLWQDWRERGPLSIWQKKGLLNIVLTFGLYIVDGTINRFSLSMTNEALLDREFFNKVSAFKHFLKPHTRPPSKTKENRILHSWHF